MQLSILTEKHEVAQTKTEHLKEVISLINKKLAFDEKLKSMDVSHQVALDS